MGLVSPFILFQQTVFLILFFRASTSRELLGNNQENEPIEISSDSDSPDPITVEDGDDDDQGPGGASGPVFVGPGPPTHGHIPVHGLPAYNSGRVAEEALRRIKECFNELFGELGLLSILSSTNLCSDHRLIRPLWREYDQSVGIPMEDAPLCTCQAKAHSFWVAL